MSEAADETTDEAGGAAEAPAAADRAKEAINRGRGRARKRSPEKEKERAEDARLVGLAKEGDAQAFRKLVERNQGRLYAVAFGMLRDRDDAMDVVQDAFIKAHKKLVDFEGNAAFSTWIYRIAVNLCIDKKRAEARRRSVDIDDVRQSDLSEDSVYAGLDIAPKLSATNPLKNAANKELGGEIGKAMAQLSEDHRTILLLREVEGMSYDEISQTLEIPRGTVMSRLFHARKNMQNLLRPFLGLEEGADLSGGG
jgi:RNA polymerase sigma-70 factor (ECF subfamily)